MEYIKAKESEEEKCNLLFDHVESLIEKKDVLGGENEKRRN